MESLCNERYIPVLIMKSLKVILLALLTAAITPSLLLSFNEEEIVVIVAGGSPVSKVSATDLKLIYLGEKKEWDSGKAVIPVDLDEADPTRERFDVSFLNKSASSLKYYWIQQIFTGRGVPPLELKTEQLVKEYVSSHPGAIGYIHSKNLDTAVKKLQVTGDQ